MSRPATRSRSSGYRLRRSGRARLEIVTLAVPDLSYFVKPQCWRHVLRIAFPPPEFARWR
jgi:hypothetical protein